MQQGLTNGVPRHSLPITKEQRTELAEVMAEFRRDRERAEAAENKRRSVVVRIRETGVSLRDIADVLGISHQAVQKILDRKGQVRLGEGQPRGR